MAGKFLCPRCFELQSLDSIEYICSNTSTTSKCQHAIDRMPQHPANAKSIIPASNTAINLFIVFFIVLLL